jgi:hypothetical protein
MRVICTADRCRDAFTPSDEQCRGCYKAIRTFKAEVEDWPDYQKLRVGVDADGVVHQSAWTLKPACPGDPADFAFVHAHWRPRPRKRAVGEATPTGDKDGEPGESQARSGDQPGAIEGEWTCLNCCAYWGREYNYCPTCDGIVVPAEPRGLAACRWEVGRWL